MVQELLCEHAELVQVIPTQKKRRGGVGGWCYFVKQSIDETPEMLGSQAKGSVPQTPETLSAQNRTPGAIPLDENIPNTQSNVKGSLPRTSETQPTIESQKLGAVPLDNTIPNTQTNVNV